MIFKTLFSVAGWINDRLPEIPVNILHVFVGVFLILTFQAAHESEYSPVLYGTTDNFFLDTFIAFLRASITLFVSAMGWPLLPEKLLFTKYACFALITIWMWSTASACANDQRTVGVGDMALHAVLLILIIGIVLAVSQLLVKPFVGLFFDSL